jgi:acyl-coenzyme A thioesterase PaaI-like protein
MNFTALANELNDMVPFHHHLGIKVEEVGPGFATVTLPDRSKLHNHVGTQHAGGLFSVGEAASGAAFLGAFGDRMSAITSLAQGARIQYRKLAVGRIVAHGRVDDIEGVFEQIDAHGSARFPVEVELRDPGNEVVATMTVDWYVARREIPVTTA